MKVENGELDQTIWNEMAHILENLFGTDVPENFKEGRDLTWENLNLISLDAFAIEGPLEKRLGVSMSPEDMGGKGNYPKTLGEMVDRFKTKIISLRSETEEAA